MNGCEGGVLGGQRKGLGPGGGTQGSGLSLGFAGGHQAPGLAGCLPHIS